MRDLSHDVVVVRQPNHKWYMRVKVGGKNVVEVKDGESYFQALGQLERKIFKWHERSEQRLRNKIRAFNKCIESIRESEPIVNRGITNGARRKKS